MGWRQGPDSLRPFDRSHADRSHIFESLLPAGDRWSTPFADILLQHLDLRPGLSMLDVASGRGIPAFLLAEAVGPSGQVVGVDLSAGQVAQARALQGARFPWLRFECADMRALPSDWPQFDRISGNLSVMFLRPDRPEALGNLITRLKPGGQIVLTFPSQGTFHSLWSRVDAELVLRGLGRERARFQAYLAERPSLQEGRRWLESLGLAQIVVEAWPLEVETGSGEAFLHHPLLRGGFLDDVYECFDEGAVADAFMSDIAADVARIRPLIAQRGVLAAWKPLLPPAREGEVRAEG